MINRAALKYEAKQDMRGKNPSVYLVAFVFIAISYVLSALASRLMYPGLSIRDLVSHYDAMDYKWMEQFVLSMRPSGTAQLLNIAISIISVIIGFGFSYYCLRIARAVSGNFGDLLEGFSLFFKVFLLNLVMGIFVALWSMLFIIPGIVAAYRYSMAFYILIDDPELGVMDCIRESKRITQGYKGQLFVLDLSFIGWALLSAIPFVSIYTMPYMEVTKAKYYNVLSGRYQFDGESSGDADNSQSGGYDSSRDPWDN